MGRNKTYSLLLLAGGKSSRMGKNKATLFYKGKTFAENLIDKAEKLGIEKIYVSGFMQERKTVQIVWDEYPDRGPLGGLHACMKIMDTPYCLVLPVDVPQIPQEVLGMLLQAHEEYCEKHGKNKLPFLLEHGDRKEHLIGIYPVRMRDEIEARIKDHPASVYGMLDDWGCKYYKLDIPEWQVTNVNTPEAYERLLLQEQKDIENVREDYVGTGRGTDLC